MKYFIVDDDISILRILENLIDSKNLGKVVGSIEDPYKIERHLEDLEVDIFILDLLMPGIDGITLIGKIKSMGFKESKFIMISQVSTKDMIAKAYEAGVEFFINKPVNVIEVSNVINNVIKKVDMERLLKKLEVFFNTEKDKDNEVKNIEDKNQVVKRALLNLGILGEAGTKDVLTIIEYLEKNNLNSFKDNFCETCSKISDNPKAMEQRVRRVVNSALNNISNLGIEDYMNEIFTLYASSLFGFDEVKAQMDYIRGKKNYGGKINVKKFIEGLLAIKSN